MPQYPLRLLTVVYAAGLWFFAAPSIGAAQQRLPPVALTRSAPMVTLLVNDARAGRTSSTYNPIAVPRDSVTPRRTHRTRHALIGGALGSIAGVATCYYIVGFGSDGGDTAACRPLGRVMFALGGFGAGALLGALIP